MLLQMALRRGLSSPSCWNSTSHDTGICQGLTRGTTVGW